MKVTKITVSLGKTVNLGDYNSARADVTAEVELQDGESASEAFAKLRSALQSELFAAVASSMAEPGDEQSTMSPEMQSDVEENDADQTTWKDDVNPSEALADATPEPAESEPKLITDDDFRTRSGKFCSILSMDEITSIVENVCGTGITAFRNVKVEKRQAVLDALANAVNAKAS